MPFKLQTSVHPSVSCPEVVFKLFPKTMGKRIELDKKLATEYNSLVRQHIDERSLMFETARAKAMEVLGLNVSKPSTIIQISSVKNDDGTTAQAADQIDAQSSPHFQIEMYKHLDFAKLAALDERIKSVRQEKLRPIYMEVYLHSVKGLMVEEGEDEEYLTVDYKFSMSAVDKERFYKLAPYELIEEIFIELDKEITMSEIERANFELPTTGSAAVEAAKTGKTPVEATTAINAVPASSM